MTNTANRLIALALIGAVVAACSEPESDANPTESTSPVETATAASKGSMEKGLEEQVQHYLELFPYQDTYKYVMLYTKGDLSKLNTWVMVPW